MFWIKFINPVYLILLDQLSASQLCFTWLYPIHSGVSTLSLWLIIGPFSPHPVYYTPPTYLDSWKHSIISFLFDNLQPRDKPLVFNVKLDIPALDHSLTCHHPWLSGSFHAWPLGKTMCLTQPLPLKTEILDAEPLFGPTPLVLWVTRRGKTPSAI